MLPAPHAWAFTGGLRGQGLPVSCGVPSQVRSFPVATWQRYTAEGEVDAAGLRCGEPAT